MGVVKITLTEGKVLAAVAVNSNSGGEQVNGRERGAATLLSNLDSELEVAWNLPRATSSPPLDASWETRWVDRRLKVFGLQGTEQQLLS